MWRWIVSHRKIASVLLIVMVISVLVSSVEGQKHWCGLRFDRNTGTAFFGVLLASIAILYAVYQIELSREVEVLEEMPKIVSELTKVVRNAKEEILLLASTPAIGASGAEEEARNLLNAYRAKIEDKNLPKEGMKVLSYSEEYIQRFYEDRGIEYASTVTSITRDCLTLLAAGETHEKVKMVEVSVYCQVPTLHLVIADPDSRSSSRRIAILWYLELSKDEQVSGTGFKTSNDIVIQTLRMEFDEYMRIWKGAEEHPCRTNAEVTGEEDDED